MKRRIVYIAMALAVALAAGALTGCGQKAPTESSPAPESSSVLEASSTITEPAKATQTKDEIIAELKSAAASNPEFKSVTVNETTEWAYADGSNAAPATERATGVYKFEMDGDQLKESVSAEYEGIKMQYFTDGKNAVFVSDGPAYSGTAEQFGAQDYSGFDAFIKHTIGDLEALVGCVDSAEKAEGDGLTYYILTLDPAKYIATDELLAALAQAGMPVEGAVFSVAFDKSGNVASMDLALAFSDFALTETLAFSDFDSTVADPAPEATVTFEEMEESARLQIEELMKNLDSYEGSAKGTAATDPAKAN